MSTLSKPTDSDFRSEPEPLLQWERKDISDLATRWTYVGVWLVVLAVELGFGLWRPKPWTGERVVMDVLRILPIVVFTRLAFTDRVTKLSEAGIFGYRWGLIPWEEISRVELRPHVMKLRRRGHRFSRPFFFLPHEDRIRAEVIRLVVFYLPDTLIDERDH